MLSTLHRLDPRDITGQVVGAIAALTNTPGLTRERLNLMLARPDCHILYAGRVSAPDALATLQLQPRLAGSQAWLDVWPRSHEVAQLSSAAAAELLVQACVKIARAAGLAEVSTTEPLPWGDFRQSDVGYYSIDPRRAVLGQPDQPNSTITRLCPDMVKPQLVAQLNVLTAALTPVPLTEDRLRGILGDDTHYVYMLCSRWGCPIGTISLFVQPELGLARGWIENIVCHPNSRNRGIGRKLLRHAIAEAQRLGVELLQLTSTVNSSPARNLYIGCGFKLSPDRIHRCQIT